MNKNVYEKKLIKIITDSITNSAASKYISSIILTGSLGRNEATYSDNDGELSLKSDIEIAIVLKKLNKINFVLKEMLKIKKSFTEDLNLMILNENRISKVQNFNYSFISPKYKTIFTYDLFNGSRTIWGEDFIGKNAVNLSQVDKYEAKRLVANRIAEMIYLNSSSSTNKNFLISQWKGKIILAIVSAWLLCEDKYESSYHKQYDNLLSCKEKVKEVLSEDFIEDYKKVFAFLRKSGPIYEVSDQKLRYYVHCIDGYFANYNICLPKVNSVSRTLKYFIKYAITGFGYGLCNFENNILQSVITDYCTGSKNIIHDSEIWHKVLY